MAERDRPVYCARCGSTVGAGNNFCGVCGTRVSPEAPAAAPTREIPGQVPPPRNVRAGAPRGTPALIVGLVVAVVLLLGVGTIFGLALLGGEPETGGAPEPGRAASQQEAENEKAEKANASRPAEEERLGVGDSVEAGGVRATLNDVRVLPATDSDRPVESPDNLFLATDLTFENVSDEPLAVSSLLEFVLKNKEGYSATQTTHTRQRRLAEGEISPGQKTSGEIVYEVPPDSGGLQLDYRPFLQEDTHTWYIGAVDTLPRARAPKTEAPQTASASAAQVPAGSETELIEAAEEYYQAVDQENWAYTYDNLDSLTRALFTEEEWYAKNQWFADNEGLELSTINVVVNGSTSEPVVSVTIYRTFKDGTSITRDTFFVPEGGVWKHRFSQDEISIFMPGVPYEEFVAAQ